MYSIVVLKHYCCTIKNEVFKKSQNYKLLTCSELANIRGWILKEDESLKATYWIADSWSWDFPYYVLFSWFIFLQVQSRSEADESESTWSRLVSYLLIPSPVTIVHPWRIFKTFECTWSNQFCPWYAMKLLPYSYRYIPFIWRWV